ncbi:22569_t:CDS:2, partial [Racocetra persica]
MDDVLIVKDGQKCDKCGKDLVSGIGCKNCSTIKEIFETCKLIKAKLESDGNLILTQEIDGKIEELKIKSSDMENQNYGSNFKPIKDYLQRTNKTTLAYENGELQNSIKSITLQGDKLIIEYQGSKTETKPVSSSSEFQQIKSYLSKVGKNNLSLSDLEQSSNQPTSPEKSNKALYIGLAVVGILVRIDGKRAKDLIKKEAQSDVWFIGDIILAKKNNDEEGNIYDIIDGQQRLITIFILLSVIYKKISGLDNEEIENKINDFLFWKKNQLRMILNNQDDQENFQKNRENGSREAIKVINTTGLELGISDLVKSLFISRSDSLYNQERVFKRWNSEVVKRVSSCSSKEVENTE